MVTQRRLLRLLPCLEGDHLRASHYLLAPSAGYRRKHFTRPREPSTPLPCHILHCTCSRFAGSLHSVLCPVCSWTYAGRAGLELHFYGKHPGLSTRERSVLLRGVFYPIVSARNAFK